MDHSLPHLVVHVVHILTLAQGIVILVMATLLMPALKKMVRITQCPKGHYESNLNLADF